MLPDLDAAQGERKPQPFLQTTFNTLYPEFSPDGRWIAYASTESGRSEIYAQLYPGPGGKWQVSNDGGVMPRWSRDGRELFYRNRDRLMAVGVEATPSFRASSPRTLFEGSFVFPYDVAPNGKRFLMIKGGE